MIDHPAPNRRQPGRASQSGILAVVLTYAIFASLWILLSDKAVEWLFSDPALIILASTLKGGLFVFVTSILLYGLMLSIPVSATLATPSVSPSSLMRPTLPFALLAAAILALTTTAISHTFLYQRDKEIARFQAIADLKTRQIVDWLKERQGDAEFVQTSQHLAADYRRWREAGDLSSRDQLQAQLAQLGQGQRFAAVMLLDTQGERLWSSAHAPREIAPALRDVARQAAADRKIHWVGPYRGLAGTPRLDFVVPLKALGANPPLVVLHNTPTDWLYHTLKTWPAPSASGESLLFRRDGDQVLFLNELRHRRDAALKLRLPVSTPKLLSAQVLRGEAESGSMVEGEDYRGVPSLGVVHAIPGTDWFLIAKVDRAELYDEAIHDSIWIGLVGLLALFMAAAGHYLLRQRQQLALAVSIQQSQAEHLRALNLLAAIADSSDDAIFAKDLEGRYTLFNRAASDFSGKPAEEVLGRDERSIFPPEQAEMVMAINRQVIAEDRVITQEEVLGTPAGERVCLTTKGPLRDADGEVIGIFGIVHDITERKQAELALRKSEETFRCLFENMFNSVVHARIIFQGDKPVDMEYLSTNPAFAAVTGITEPVVGRRISEIIPGYCENNSESLDIFGRVATTGVPTRWEHYLRELDRWFSFMIYSSTLDEVVIITENITERKKAELALRESEQRFRALFNNNMDGVLLTTPDGHILAVNPEAQRIFGYSEDELCKLGRQAVVDVSDPRLAAALKQREISGRFCGELTLLHKNGTKFPAELSSLIFEDTNGRKMTSMIVRDISVRKAAEVALHRQTEELTQRNAELERFNRAVVGRELDMIALKQQINALSAQLGLEPPYPLAFLKELAPPSSGEDTP